MDPDVPSVGDTVNQKGRTLPADMPRIDFCHWVMVDIPADVNEVTTGQCSDGVTPRGKKNPAGPDGSRQGLNDYTGFMEIGRASSREREQIAGVTRPVN